jgi:hypothetical protein
MQNYSRITPKPDCFERQRPSRECHARCVEPAVSGSRSRAADPDATRRHLGADAGEEHSGPGRQVGDGDAVCRPRWCCVRRGGAGGRAYPRIHKT